MIRRTLQALTIVAALVLATFTLGGTAHAEHDHFVLTPNGKCHQVAQGQTSLPPGHGGDHKFHDNVHVGATDFPGGAGHFGNGNSPVVLKSRAALPEGAPCG